MSNLVIVAIPDENDRVWKVSSEKIPHLTLLLLGEGAQNLEQIVQFVEHAASQTLKRFYMTVDRRGELGEEKADVLFFKRSRYDFKAIRDFRSTLLQDHNIKTAYDSAEQFEGPWQPHLTLGYPDTPAKPLPTDRDYEFYDVCFNKIAVWTDDYDGPAYVLKDYWDELEDMIDMDVAMSDIQHHGVKGQKWGVRNTEHGGHIRINKKTDIASPSKKVNTSILVPALLMPPLTPVAFLSARVRAEVKASRAHNKGVKADTKWKKQLTSADKAVEVHNKAADEINSKLPGFNNDKRWKGIDLTKDSVKQKEYDTAVERELLNPEYAKAAVKVHGTSPTGKYKFEIVDAATATLKLTDTTKVEHTAEDELSVQFQIVRDENGHILGFTLENVEDSMAQTVDLGAEWLTHHGIKGMKWGQRNKRPAPTAVPSSAMSVVPHGTKSKTKIKTEGGENHPAHEDAIKVAEARAKLAKSGPAALSNKELRDVANRLQLEGQVKQLSTSTGQKFVSNLLRQQGQQGANQFLSTQVKKATAKAA